ncbi:MAG TPA: peptidoglycan-binding domain-containing protein [Nevskiaceae bacterium]|nr:peptidoglycan-binding domain-containing protein [Nevskiaceae bacterium]
MIDIALALGLVFLLFSALVSGIYEWLAGLFNLRGRTLLAGLEGLLGDARLASGERLREQLLAHPLIAAQQQPANWLERAQGWTRRPPSYLAASRYAMVLADLLTRDLGTHQALLRGLPEAVSRLGEGPLRESLQVLVAQAEGDAQRLQQGIEQQFDEVMSRASGWYKRRAQRWLFVIGLLAAAVLNVDALYIGRQLATDAALSARLAAEAQRTVEAGPPSGEREDAYAALREARLPIGWSQAAREQDDVLRLIGWLISALAASLGAPFWFDALSRLVSLRTAGARPPPAGAPIPAASPPPAVLVLPAAGGAAAGSEDGPLNDFERDQLNEVDIEALQAALGLPEAQRSGRLDASTRAAIRAWQQGRGQAPSGALDEAQVMALLYPET